MGLVVISHNDCVLHFAGDGHPEQSDRVSFVQQALKEYDFKSLCDFVNANLVARKDLERVHSKDYVEEIFSISPKNGLLRLDDDTLMGPASLTAARRAAGAAVQAVDLVMRDEAKVVFCNVRPPGHHAEKGRAMGFCFFNNLAVGVAYALEQYGLERIAIVDFDVHRGNGTQDIFPDDERILYCSSFEHPLYPGYEPEKDSANVISVPLPAEADGKVYREAVSAAWFDRLKAFKPQLLFFSAGFDAHTDDPLAYLHLTKEDYVWLTSVICKLVKASTKGRFISVLEGGYHIPALVDCVPAHVDAMLV